MRQSGETMTSVSASHIILTPTQPVGSGRPQRGSNPAPPSRSRALYRLIYRAPKGRYSKTERQGEIETPIQRAEKCRGGGVGEKKIEREMKFYRKTVTIPPGLTLSSSPIDHLWQTKERETGLDKHSHDQDCVDSINPSFKSLTIRIMAV